jgi:hypothetical protein
MYARVARFEGGTAEALRKAAAGVNDDVADGPPPGVRAVGYTMLFDPDSGTSMGIGFFETAEDLRASEDALQRMDPTPGSGHRVSVETFEVGADIRLDQRAAM